jgi:DNA end-binding protein Ku
MARSLVEMLSDEEFDYEQYKDEYREALLEIISKKAEGETIEAPAPQAAKITDLTEALRASVEEIRRRKAGKNGASDDEEEETPKRSRARAKSA